MYKKSIVKHCNHNALYLQLMLLQWCMEVILLYPKQQSNNKIISKNKWKSLVNLVRPSLVWLQYLALLPHTEYLSHFWVRWFATKYSGLWAKPHTAVNKGHSRIFATAKMKLLCNHWVRAVWAAREDQGSAAGPDGCGHSALLSAYWCSIRRATGCHLFQCVFKIFCLNISSNFN